MKSAWLKSLVLAAFFCNCFTGMLLAGDTNAWTAAFIKTDPTLQSFGVPKTMVEVTFPSPVPVEEARKVSAYTLIDVANPERIIALRAAHVGGGEIVPLEPDFRPDNSRMHGAKTATIVCLVAVGELNPAQNYTVTATFPSLASPAINVATNSSDSGQGTSDQPKEGAKRIWEKSGDFLSGHLTATLDSRATLDAKKTPAFDYTVNFNSIGPRLLASSNYLNGWLYNISLASEGTIKLKTSDTNVNDHINLSANGELMYFYQLADPLSREGTLAYYVGFRLKAAEIESDQQLETINYAFKPQLALWIPWSNVPGLWWSRLIGISGNPATPISLYAGYVYSQAIRENPNRVNSDLQNSDRLETELAYALPLTTHIRIGARARFFWLFDHGDFKDYEEVFARRYLDANKKTALEFRYTHGEIPPTFEKGDAASVGFSVSF